jgi:beta-ureidopropionase
MNDAEIVFNPAIICGLYEHLRPIEPRNAGLLIFFINKEVTEVHPPEFTYGDGKAPHKEFGHFYGSSYITALKEVNRMLIKI